MLSAAVPVCAIDRHRSPRFEIFERNIRRAGSPTSCTRSGSRSQDAADGFREPVELLFVDGAHDEEHRERGLHKWVPKVVDDGIVAFGTTWRPGPRRVVGRRVCRSRSFRTSRFVKTSLTMARKVESNTRADRVQARFQQEEDGVLARHPAGAEVRRRLPERVRRLGRQAIGHGEAAANEQEQWAQLEWLVNILTSVLRVR